jgi:hypothetical protein
MMLLIVLVFPLLDSGECYGLFKDDEAQPRQFTQPLK